MTHYALPRPTVCYWKSCVSQAMKFVRFPGEVPDGDGARCPLVEELVPVCSACASEARAEAERLVMEHDCAWEGMCMYCSGGYCGMMPDREESDDEDDRPEPDGPEATRFKGLGPGMLAAQKFVLRHPGCRKSDVMQGAAGDGLRGVERIGRDSIDRAIKAGLIACKTSKKHAGQSRLYVAGTRSRRSDWTA